MPAAYFYSAKLCSSLYQEVRYIKGLLYRDSTVCNFALLRVKGKGKGKQTPTEGSNKCKKCLTGEVRFKIGRVMTAQNSVNTALTRPGKVFSRPFTHGRTSAGRTKR